MAPPTSALWLLALGAILSQSGAQHWSFGLSPGGKRELDGPLDTLGNMVEGFPRVDAPCRVLGCAEVSPFPKIYRLKGFLDGESGHRTYKK